MGGNKDRKISNDGETLICTVEEFNAATYDDNTIMVDRVYQIYGEEVEDKSTK